MESHISDYHISETDICPKCGIYNSAPSIAYVGTPTIGESIVVSCRTCGYSVAAPCADAMVTANG